MKNDNEKKTIWYRPLTLEGVRDWGDTNMARHLGITYTEIGDDYMKATMPVDHRTTQPLGLLHGGASVVLAETLGSTAGSCCVDLEKQFCAGIEINANHVRGVREGIVTGTARPLHLGRTTQVWEIHIHDERERLVAVSRLTLAIIDH